MTKLVKAAGQCILVNLLPVGNATVAILVPVRITSFNLGVCLESRFIVVKERTLVKSNFSNTLQFKVKEGGQNKGKLSEPVLAENSNNFGADKEQSP